MNRRQFITAATAAAGIANAAPQQTGGENSPVRKTPLRSFNWGPGGPTTARAEVARGAAQSQECRFLAFWRAVGRSSRTGIDSVIRLFYYLESGWFRHAA